jgi:O-antigen ligase
MNVTVIRPHRDQLIAVSPLATGSRRLAQLILPVVSFEFVFVLFLFSGQYKADPRFDWIPYDATVFWGLVNSLQAVFLFLTPGFRLNQLGVGPVLVGILFAAYTASSVVWSESVDYGTYKAAYIGTICAWCLCASGLIISSSTTRLIRFFRLMFLFSGWVAIECLLFYFRNAQFGPMVDIHAMADEGAYIGLGRVVATGALICGTMWTCGIVPNWGLWNSRTGTLVALLFFVISSAVTGARGPAVAAALAIALVSILFSQGTSRISFAKGISRLGIVGAIGTAALYGYKCLFGEIPLVVMRFLAFSSSSEYYDASGEGYYRLQLFSKAFAAWLEHPVLGHGIGSFSNIWANVDERLFPHNLILELLCELGLVGLLLFMAIPCAAYFVARGQFRSADVRLKALVIALAAYAFTNTMTSGDIPDNRVIFMTIGLLCFRRTLNSQPFRPKLTLGNRPTFPKFSRRSIGSVQMSGER